MAFTSVRKEQCHLDGAESFGSSPSHRAGKTSCHSGSRYLGAITDQPHGCPKWGSKPSQNRPTVYPSSSVGNTWWWCSPAKSTANQIEVENWGKVLFFCYLQWHITSVGKSNTWYANIFNCNLNRVWCFEWKKNHVLCVCSGLTELEQAERPTHYRACNENIMT